jgi:hypothetical protein
MTDAITEMPTDPVPVPPAPEAASEFTNGSLRQHMLDHLQDTEEPQSVGQILAAMPAGTSRNTLESCLRRAREAGEIERISPGIYRLRAPRPPGAKPAPPPEPLPADDKSEDQWYAALEAWAANQSSGDVDKLGPPPNQVGNHVPPDIRTKFNDRIRKREARRKDAAEAAARQRAADADLRAKLVEAAGGNVEHGPALDDVSAIKAALSLGIPLADIVFATKCAHSKECLSSNPPLTTWRDEGLLKKIAEDYARYVLIPGIVSACMGAKPTQSAPTAAAAVTGESEAPADVPGAGRSGKRSGSGSAGGGFKPPDFGG